MDMFCYALWFIILETEAQLHSRQYRQLSTATFWIAPNLHGLKGDRNNESQLYTALSLAVTASSVKFKETGTS